MDDVAQRMDDARAFVIGEAAAENARFVQRIQDPNAAARLLHNALMHLGHVVGLLPVVERGEHQVFAV